MRKHALETVLVTLGARAVLEQKNFGVIDLRRPFLLLRRGANTARNESARKLLRAKQ
jgi:hypothetical protein